MRRVNWFYFGVVAACIAAPAYAQSKDSRKDPGQIGNRDVGSGINFYSLESEMAMGRRLAQEVEREAKLVDDPIASEFVNRLAAVLARNSDLRIPVTAKIIDSSQVNAFALPGGYLFVNSGLVLSAETEAELAGPIAHEIAHVAARHGTRQMSRGQIASIASIPLIFAGGWAGLAARQGAGVAVPLGFLKFSRAFEQEADALGIQYVFKAGYDPTAFVDFFERMSELERKKPGTLSDLFRSHPNVGARIKAVQASIQDLMPREPRYVVTTSEFNDVRQRLADLSRKKTQPAKLGPTLYRSQDGVNGPDKDQRPTLKRQNLVE